MDRTAFGKLSRKKQRRQFVLHGILYESPDRTRTIDRIKARLSDIRLDIIAPLKSVSAPLNTLCQNPELDMDNLPDLILSKRIEDHDLIDPVDELRPERMPYDIQDLLLRM